MPGNFRTLIHIQADVSEAVRNLEPRKTCGENPYTFFEFEFEVILMLGKTEVTAQVAWNDSVSTRFYAANHKLNHTPGSEQTVS